ncbi:hypothetical protein BDU57DRAFT_114732 [Ampelomyces quisqualis]|uniref:Uncharacterized protein n=1 Tax=Ampelomyces quisqualis TaxID=50730 RepID=A0A6A5Q620_AMPQU|nr:hypothetical protein BDU57DRAFT_114732 [Ampelomyces quisqualis]
MQDAKCTYDCELDNARHTADWELERLAKRVNALQSHLNKIQERCESYHTELDKVQHELKEAQYDAHRNESRANMYKDILKNLKPSLNLDGPDPFPPFTAPVWNMKKLPKKVRDRQQGSDNIF